MKNIIMLFLNLMFIANPGDLLGQTGYLFVPSYMEAEKRITGIRNMAIADLLDENYTNLTGHLNKQVVVQLTDNYNDTLKVFTISEKLLFWYWTGNFSSITKRYASIVHDNTTNAPNDSLYHIVARYSFENAGEMGKRIERIPANAKEKEFLKLYYAYLTANTSLQNISKEKIIEEAENYVNNFPDAAYSEFIRSQLLLAYKQSNFGIGFSLTGGYVISTGDVNTYFGNNIPVGGEFNFKFQRLRLDLNFTGSLASQINSTFEYDGIWEKDTRYTQATGTGSLGIEIVRNTGFSVYPLAGITTTTISSYVRDEIQGEINAKLSHFPGYLAGLTFEKRFVHQRSYSDYRERFIADNSSNFWCVRLSTGVMLPGLQQRNSMFSGEFFYVKLSVGILSLPAVSE